MSHLTYKAISRAHQRCLEGTATITQYQLLFAPTLASSQAEVLASLPALVAREEAGGAATAMGALAYPPAEKLPVEIRQALNWCRNAATADPFPTWGSPGAQQTWAQHRARAAHALLTLGGNQGAGLRRRAWQMTDRGAVPSEEVTQLSAVWTLTMQDADAFLGWQPSLTEITYAQMRPGDITAVSWLLDSATITYPALAQIIALLPQHHGKARPIPGVSRSDWIDFILPAA